MKILELFEKYGKTINIDEDFNWEIQDIENPLVRCIELRVENFGWVIGKMDGKPINIEYNNDDFGISILTNYKDMSTSMDFFKGQQPLLLASVDEIWSIVFIPGIINNSSEKGSSLMFVHGTYDKISEKTLKMYCHLSFHRNLRILGKLRNGRRIVVKDSLLSYR